MFFISLLILTLATIAASLPANLRNRMHINNQVELGLDRAWMTLSPTCNTDALLIEGQGAKGDSNLESVSPFITIEWL